LYNYRRSKMDHVHCDSCGNNTEVKQADVTGKCKISAPYRKREVIRFRCRCGKQVESFVHR
jgi:hypothetical protein